MIGERWTAYWFVGPAALMLAGVLGFPAVVALLESLNMTGGKAQPGVGNFLRLASDAEFRTAATNTALFVAGVVGFHLSAGLAVALLLNQDMPGRWLFRLLAILPWTVPDVIGGLVFRSLFDTLTGGINAVALLAGLSQEPVDWLGMPGLALPAVMLAESWRGYPYVMLILLAGLQAVPGDQYEAAALDGAGRLRTFLSITLPNLRPMLAVAAVLDVVWECRLFGMVFGMTGGGPGVATENLSLMVYKQYFQFFDTGYASAIAVVLAFVLLLVALPYVRSTVRRDA